jgi:hypothetical protein
MPQILATFLRDVLELESMPILEEVLAICAQHDVKPEVAVVAFADAVALIAVTQDLDRGQPRSVADRLQSFYQRVELTYARAYPQMDARRRSLAGAGV